MTRLPLAVLSVAASMAIACTAIMDFSDPIDSETSLPELLEDRVEVPLAFAHPDECAPCHQQHYDEWQITPHAYAMKDPVFKAMVDLGQAATEGKLGQFCVQCHSPTGLATGQTTVALDDDTQVFKQNLALDPIGMSGVTCTACHSITNVIETANARLVYTPNGILNGPIKDPVDNDFHASAYSELFDDKVASFGPLCGSCHNVITPKGARLERTYEEFETSSHKGEGKTCVSCHMPEYTGKAAVGTEAPEGLPDRTLHRHLFVGVDVSLLPESEFPGYQEMRDLVQQLLEESTEFTAIYNQATQRIEASITNLAGHAIPSGATAERQMWIELIVRDSMGVTVFESGTLDAEGNLRDGIAGHSLLTGTDPQLAYFGQVMIGIDGFADMDEAEKAAAREQVDEDCLTLGLGGITADSIGHPVDMPWQADWQCDDLIGPDLIYTRSYAPGNLAPGNYTATARLLFRSFPPYFLKKLETEAGLDPAVKDRVPTVVMESAVVDFTVL